METTTTMVKITTVTRRKERTHIGIRTNRWLMMELWIPLSLKTKLFSIWLVSINKVTSQYIKKGLKERKKIFTQLGESYEEIFMKLLARNLVHPYNATKFCIPKVKPWWWDEKAYCKLYNGIGHNIENCGSFKHIVQDLIENGKLEIDGLNTNADHTMFKEPFPKYEKVEASQPKNGTVTINYTHENA